MVVDNSHDMKEEFEEAISIAKQWPGKYPCLDLILSEDAYKEALFNEFIELTPKLAKRAIEHKTYKVISPPIDGIDRIAVTETTYEDYPSRSLKDTTIIKMLNAIQYQITLLEKHVLKPTTDTYTDIATAIARKIISLVDKIHPEEFRTAILEAFMYREINITLQCKSIIGNMPGLHSERYSDSELNHLNDEYAKLKAIADKYISDELKKSNSEQIIPTQQNTNATSLKASLINYGFLQLPKVTCLKDPYLLIEVLSRNDTPYCIAMFEYLDYIDFISEKYVNYRIGKRNNIIAEILNVSVDNVKNNINNLNRDHNRYTSKQHKQTVLNDYNNIRRER